MDDFYYTVSLSDMTDEQWEALCDGCGLCCLVKLEDEDTGEVYNTSVCCRLLDTDNCRCRDYPNRFEKAPMCTQLTKDNIAGMDWLPDSCAYKCLMNKQPLPGWHYLVSGDRNSVHEAGISVKWFAQSEEYVHAEQLPDFIIFHHEVK